MAFLLVDVLAPRTSPLGAWSVTPRELARPLPFMLATLERAARTLYCAVVYGVVWCAWDWLFSKIARLGVVPAAFHPSRPVFYSPSVNPKCKGLG